MSEFINCYRVSRKPLTGTQHATPSSKFDKTRPLTWHLRIPRSCLYAVQLILIGISQSVAGAPPAQTAEDLARAQTQLYAKLTQHDINAHNAALATNIAGKRWVQPTVLAIMNNSGTSQEERQFRTYLQSAMTAGEFGPNGPKKPETFMASLRKMQSIKGFGDLLFMMSETDSYANTEVFKQQRKAFLENRIFQNVTIRDGYHFFKYVQEELKNKPEALALVEQLVNSISDGPKWNDPTLNPLVENTLILLEQGKDQAAVAEELQSQLLLEFKKYGDHVKEENLKRMEPPAGMPLAAPTYTPTEYYADLRRDGEIRSGIELVAMLMRRGDPMAANRLLVGGNAISDAYTSWHRYNSPVESEQIGELALTQNWISGVVVVTSLFSGKQADPEEERFKILLSILQDMQRQLESIGKQVFALTRIALDGFDASLRATQDANLKLDQIRGDLAALQKTTYFAISLQYQIQDDLLQKRLRTVLERCFRPLLYGVTLKQGAVAQCLTDTHLLAVSDAIGSSLIRSPSDGKAESMLRILGSPDFRASNSIAELSPYLNAVNLAAKQYLPITGGSLPPVLPHISLWLDSAHLFAAIAARELDSISIKLDKDLELIEQGNQIQSFIAAISGSKELFANISLVADSEARELTTVVRSFVDELYQTAKAAGQEGFSLGHRLDDGIPACEKPDPVTNIQAPKDHTFRGLVPQSYWIAEALGFGIVAPCYTVETWLDNLSDDWLEKQQTVLTNYVMSRLAVHIHFRLLPTVRLQAPSMFRSITVGKYHIAQELSNDEKANALADHSLYEIAAGQPSDGFDLVASIKSEYYHEIGPLNQPGYDYVSRLNTIAARHFSGTQPCNNDYACFKETLAVGGKCCYEKRLKGTDLGLPFLTQNKELDDPDGQAKKLRMFNRKLLLQLLKDRSVLWDDSQGRLRSELDRFLTLDLLSNDTSPDTIATSPQGLRESSRRIQATYPLLFAHLERWSAEQSSLFWFVSSLSKLRTALGLETVGCARMASALDPVATLDRVALKVLNTRSLELDALVETVLKTEPGRAGDQCPIPFASTPIQNVIAELEALRPTNPDSSPGSAAIQ